MSKKVYDDDFSTIFIMNDLLNENSQWLIIRSRQSQSRVDDQQIKSSETNAINRGWNRDSLYRE